MVESSKNKNSNEITISLEKNHYLPGEILAGAVYLSLNGVLAS